MHPASYALANESGRVEADSGEYDRHAFGAIRRMDEIVVANSHVFDDVTENEHFAVLIADEAWGVDYSLHENPDLKRSPYLWFTGFVGWLAMPRRRRGRIRPDGRR